MIRKLAIWMASPWYWLAVMFTGLAMEGMALFYQYVLEELPCVICIHTRAWTLGLIVAGALGLVLRRWRAGRIAVQLLALGALAGLLERTWYGLGVERGTIAASCHFDPGFPAWLALDRWLPSVFEVQGLCGLSPDFLLGLTMFEGLWWGAWVIVAVCIVFLYAALRQTNSKGVVG